MLTFLRWHETNGALIAGCSNVFTRPVHSGAAPYPFSTLLTICIAHNPPHMSDDRVHALVLSEGTQYPRQVSMPPLDVVLHAHRSHYVRPCMSLQMFPHSEWNLSNTSILRQHHAAQGELPPLRGAQHLTARSA